LQLGAQPPGAISRRAGRQPGCRRRKENFAESKASALWQTCIAN
jgi:hypothetical protein